MPLARRPSGLPKRIPPWAWKWLKWRNRRKPAPNPTPAPGPTPVPVPKPRPKPKPSLPIKGCDYVSGPTVTALKAAGIRFVGRYLSTPGNPKNITALEAKKLHDGGIHVILVFETTANRALGGTNAGHADAISARSQAKALGVPAAVPIYFAIDFDATPGEQQAIDNYFKAAGSVLGGKSRVGAYGGYWPIKRLFDADLIGYGWQTYAWSGGRWDGRAQVRQVANGRTIGGHSVDLDMAVKTPYGAW
jgi:hypothetical protein